MRGLALAHRVVGHGQPAVSTGAAAAEPVHYADLPPVEVVDMRLELRAGNRSILSRSLQGELHATLDAGEQAILFLNRRGSSTFVNCRDCGHVETCLRCDVPLTYHERANTLICHHCNRRTPIPTTCPICGSKRIRYFGAGTQRIEELVQQIAPRARLLRWDADTTAGKGSHETILQRFASREADVLVGTQMIAKGLDLPMVTLVGVISADVGLYLPDFRAGERTFQLLTQVAGRAGRSRRGGRVVIQTYTPDHYVIQAAARHDYAAFYRRELAYRQEHAYPPVRRMARLVYWDKRPDRAQQTAEAMAAALRSRVHELRLEDHVTLVGPAPAFFARYRGYYRWQVLLSADDPAAVLRPLEFAFGWRVDVDPVSVL
jgi:primosomal protein N' (replication factor Y)